MLLDYPERLTPKSHSRLSRDNTGGNKWNHDKHECTLEAKTQAQPSPQNSFKTPDDDQCQSKHVVDNMFLNKFKTLIVYKYCICSNF
jgi:hypothetical protein